MRKRQSFFFFFFEWGSCFWQRKLWPTNYVFIITTQRFVLLLGFASFFKEYSLNNIIKLRKRQELFKRPTFGKKPFFLTKKFGNYLPYCSTLLAFCLFAIIYSTRPRNDFATVPFSWNFFSGKEEVSAFLAISTPVIWRKNARRRLGMVHGVSAKLFMLFVPLTVA